jgi:hypothetical protein
MIDRPFDIIIIVEAYADYKIATDIAEKVIREYVPDRLLKIIDSKPEDVFSWSGIKSGTSYSCWADIKKILNDLEQDGYHFPRILGHNKQIDFDYASGKKVLNAINAINNNSRNIPAVVFIRDADNQSDKRKQSLNELKDDKTIENIQVIIGFAIPKREAWVLNGFEPQNKKERHLLENYTKCLNFNPCIEAHRLRGKISQPGTENRDIKHILQVLVEDNHCREEQCWQVTSLDKLYKNGQQTGLSDFIDDIRNVLLPILIGN